MCCKVTVQLHHHRVVCAAACSKRIYSGLQPSGPTGGLRFFFSDCGFDVVVVGKKRVPLERCQDRVWALVHTVAALCHSDIDGTL